MGERGQVLATGLDGPGMTRGAKAVALDDLSFWRRTLPALERFHRIMSEYEATYGLGVYLPHSASHLTLISDAALHVLGTQKVGPELEVALSFLGEVDADGLPDPAASLLTRRVRSAGRDERDRRRWLGDDPEW